MGTISRDIDKRSREYENSYPYEAAGIAVLLRDVHRLNESRIYDGDIDATTILIDLKMALDSNCLTPRMRQVIALRYFAEFTEEETADVIGITQQGVNNSLSNALERISVHMEYGYTKVTNAKLDATLPCTHEIKRWLNAVAYGRELYDIDDEVLSGINIWRASKLKDAKDLEAIKQRVEGYTYEPVYENEEKEYPALTWEQFKWRDRRMSFKSEIFPPGDIVGTRKVAIKLRDGDDSGNEWILEKRKLFARNLN